MSKIKKEILKAIELSGGDVEPIRNGEIDLQKIAGKILSTRQGKDGITEMATSLNLLDIVPFDRVGRKSIVKRTIVKNEVKLFITIASTNTEGAVDEFFISKSKEFNSRKHLTLAPLKNGLKLFYYLVDKLKTDGYIDKKLDLPFVIVSLSELKKVLWLKKSRIKKLLLELNFTSISVVAQYKKDGRTITEDVVKGKHIISVKTIDKSYGQKHYPYIIIYLNPEFLPLLGVNSHAWIGIDSLEALSPTALEILFALKRWSKEKEFRMRAVDLMNRLDIDVGIKKFKENIKRISDSLDELKDREVISDWQYFESSQIFLIKK